MNKKRKNIEISKTIFEWLKDSKGIINEELQSEYIKNLVVDILNFDIFIKEQFNHKLIFQIFRNDYKKEFITLKLPSSISDTYEKHKNYLINDKDIKVNLCFIETEDFKKYINTALLHICIWGKYDDTIEKYTIKYDEIINIDFINVDYIYTFQQFENERKNIFKLNNKLNKTREYEKTNEIIIFYIYFICNIMKEKLLKKEMIKLLKKVFEKEYYKLLFNKKLLEITNYMIRHNITKDRSETIQLYYTQQLNI